MRKLSVGVYNARGKALLRGSERSADDFYLYDFELTAIGNRLQRGDSSDASKVVGELNQMVAALNAAGARPQLPAMTPAQFQNALISATRSSRRQPHSRGSLVPLLIRELGLRHRPAYDTASRVPLERLKLDALQRSLLLADMADTIIRQVRPSRRSRAAKPRSGAGMGAHTARACDFSEGTGLGRFGRWAISVAPAIKKVKVGDYLKLVNILLDLYHAGNLALLIDFQYTTGGQVRATHYGPQGHEGRNGPAGRNLQFQVGLQMLDDLPEDVVRCGALLGLRFPKRGPVAGVPIDWTDIFGAYETLTKHGTILRQDAETGRDGIATLVFKPRDEVVAGVGEERDAIEYLVPSAHFLSVFGNTLGYLTERITPLIARGGGGFVITYHVPKLALRFSSNVFRSVPFQDVRMALLAGFPLTPLENPPSIHGTGQLGWTDFFAHFTTVEEGCAMDGTGTEPGLIEVTNLVIEDRAPVDPDPGVTLSFRVDPPIEHYQWSGTGNCDEAAVEGLDTIWWYLRFQSWFLTGTGEEEVPGGARVGENTFVLSRWQRGSGDVIARKTWADSEATYTFELVAQ